MRQCLVCGSRDTQYSFSYDYDTKRKERKWFRCFCCLALTGENLRSQKFYERAYYQTQAYIRKRFKDIENLPNSQSNNYYRVQRLKDSIEKYEKSFFLKERSRKILDVGCGFGIFLYKFLKANPSWKGVGVDLDKRLKRFLKTVGIEMIISKNIAGIKEKFDLITFNRMIEHVKSPVILLKKAKVILKDSGLIYLEVPDVLSLKHQGKNSEAFMDDHYAVFAPKSIFITAQKSGLRVLSLSRLREVNNKFTIIAFLAKQRKK